MPNIKQALGWARTLLEESGIQDAHRSSTVLLEYVLGQNQTYFIAHPDQELTPDAHKAFEKYVQLRADKQPVAYITGQKEFYGRTFRVTPDVLIPRPETELIIDLVCDLMDQPPTMLLDVGTGSGIIPITLNLELQGVHATGVDISPMALKVAKQNADHFQADVTFYESDLFSSVQGQFDVITANLPYIPSDEIKNLAPEVQKEPLCALDGGASGLRDIYALIKGAKTFLRQGGHVFLEIGFDQTQEVSQVLAENEFRDMMTHHDLQGHPRIIHAVR